MEKDYEKLSLWFVLKGKEDINFKEQVKGKAKENHLSISNYIVSLLEKDLKDFDINSVTPTPTKKEKKYYHIDVTIDEDLKSKVKEKAKSYNYTMAMYVRNLIIEDLKKDL